MLNLFSVPDDSLSSVRRGALSTAIILVAVCYYSLEIDLQRLGFISSNKTTLDPTFGLTVILGYLIVRLYLIADWAVPLGHHNLVIGDNATKKMLENLESIEDLAASHEAWADKIRGVDLGDLLGVRDTISDTNRALRSIQSVVGSAQDFLDNPKNRGLLPPIKDRRDFERASEELRHLLSELSILEKGSPDEFFRQAISIIERKKDALNSYDEAILAFRKGPPYQQALNFIMDLDEDYQRATSKKKRDAIYFGRRIPLFLSFAAFAYGIHDLLSGGFLVETIVLPSFAK